MHRSSESIAAIATALAKAQIDLANPEKSLVGAIYLHNRADCPQHFRYASLSSGLEIVRKALGSQQIAVAQITDVDRASGLINLITVLMHTSGEWICSEWPICPISETSTPRRMGAALTYARRYALFTLVGIAGEDDLDAPDLQPAGLASVLSPATVGADTRSKRRDEQARERSTVVPPTKPNKVPLKEKPSVDESEAIRVQLQAEIQSSASSQELQMHAIDILKTKNRLALEDARQVESAFAVRMRELDAGVSPTLASSVVDFLPVAPLQPDRRAVASAELGLAGVEPARVSKSGTLVPNGNSPPPKRQGQPRKAQSDTPSETTPDPASQLAATSNPTGPTDTGPKIQKSELVFAEPRRKRDKAHLRFVASQPCLICGRSPSDAHHLRFAQARAMQRKSSDEFTVPLCRAHHRENHRTGSEHEWWRGIGIDPLRIAFELWSQTRMSAGSSAY